MHRRQSLTKEAGGPFLQQLMTKSGRSRYAPDFAITTTPGDLFGEPIVALYCFQELSNAFGINFDGSRIPEVIVGSFADGLFKIAAPEDILEAPHVLLKVNWTGKHRGKEKSLAKVLGATHFYTTCNNLCTSGVDYWIMPVSKAQPSEEEFKRILADFQDLVQTLNQSVAVYMR